VSGIVSGRIPGAGHGPRRWTRLSPGDWDSKPPVRNKGSKTGTRAHPERFSVMPRYFLHVCNGNGFVQDEEGIELPDLDAARLEAMRSARSIMASDVQRGILDLSSFIEVEDCDGKLVLTLGFQQAVDLTQRH
jgi:hypothetical protein